MREARNKLQRCAEVCACWTTPPPCFALVARPRVIKHKKTATMTHATALSSSVPPSAENGVIDAGPSVARRPYTQPTCRGRLVARANAWAMQLRCLQAPPQRGHSQRRRCLRRLREPSGADRRGRPFPMPSDLVGSAGDRRYGQSQRTYGARDQGTKLENFCMMGADALDAEQPQCPAFDPGGTQQ